MNKLLRQTANLNVFVACSIHSFSLIRTIILSFRDLIDMYIDENKSMVKRMFGEYSPRDDRDSSTRDNKISTFDGSPVYNKKKSRRPKRSYTSKFNDNSK